MGPTNSAKVSELYWDVLCREESQILSSYCIYHTAVDDRLTKWSRDFKMGCTIEARTHNFANQIFQNGVIEFNDLVKCACLGCFILDCRCEQVDKIDEDYAKGCLAIIAIGAHA